MSHDVVRILGAAMVIAVICAGCAGPDWTERIDAAVEAERNGDLAEAERLFGEAVGSLAERRDGGGAELIRALTGEARVRASRGDIDGALPLFQRALDLQVETLEPGSPELAIAYYRVATAYQSAGRTAEARALHEQALAAGEAAYGEDAVELCETLNSLGLLDVFEGRLDDAERNFRRSLDIMQLQLMAGHPNLVSAHGNLGQVYRRLGNIAAAEEQYALAIETARMNALPARAASAHTNLGNMYREEGRLAEAEAHLLAAIDLLQPIAERYPSELSTALNSLGMTYVSLRRYGEAETYYLRAVEFLEPLGDSPGLATSLFNLARSYARQSRFDEAEPVSARAVAMFEATEGPRSPSLAAALESHAAVLRSLGRKAEAETAAERARTLRGGG